MTAQAPISFFDTSDTSLPRAKDPFLSAATQSDPDVQRAEGFAVIWRNAQRARSELLGVWFRASLWKLSHAVRSPPLPSAEGGGNPRKPTDRLGDGQDEAM
jgi:hypothetical protein